MNRRYLLVSSLVVTAVLAGVLSGDQQPKLYLNDLDVNPKPIATDTMVKAKYDYDIVYVRVPRKGDKEGSAWAEVFHPAWMDKGGDLMLLRPDGTEELLVAGGDGSIVDPMVSFDGEWVYYSHIHNFVGSGQSTPPAGGADIYKLHVKSRKIVRLTHQEYTPNTGAANWSSDFRKPEADKVYMPFGPLNMGPCPLPGGKIIFTSSRNAFKAPKHAWPVQQLFVMDDDGSNIEMIGHLNIGMALHPVVLMDGRVMFSTLESQGLRNTPLWGLWSIHPDGTNWAPMFSAFDRSFAAPTLHFQTQLTDSSIVAQLYYNNNNNGFGTYVKFPVKAPEGVPAFGPANTLDPRNNPVRVGRHDNGHGMYLVFPFSPYGLEALTPFTTAIDTPANNSIRNQPTSPRVGKFIHPGAAPDNHLLTVWSPGAANQLYDTRVPQIDAGIYLLKDGKPIDEPGKLLLIKNDPKYNEQWPRALVPYKRIYGIEEPKRLTPLANDGKLSPHLPEGTPFGLTGTSSLYKRETYPLGAVPPGKVTATYLGGNDPARGLNLFNYISSASTNWINQGADAGLYSNDDIHAIRILAMEATTHRGGGPKSGTQFYSHAQERLRILGEIPVRKFQNPTNKAQTKDGQPIDPDGNPDTSFLVKIPADVAFTFQTLDKDGMLLNHSQTWHQLRPGEIRNDCGGCHAHSQKPTLFKDTAAAKPDYQIFDLTKHTPLLTDKANDKVGKKWDKDDTTGLRFETDVKNLEFHRDIQPILERSCVACHTKKSQKPAGNLVMDDEQMLQVGYLNGGAPGTYHRIAHDTHAKSKWGHPPVRPDQVYWSPNASRYIRMFQSRRSLLVWKIYGRRLDGWTNNDFPTETVPGDITTLQQNGKLIDAAQRVQISYFADLDYTGSQMPPAAAVEGTYVGPDGKKIKVEPLSDEDRRTITRWIDIGCPVDFEYSPARPNERGVGWMCDDNRPTLTVTYPKAGPNTELTRILVGMDDYYTGINMKTFEVTADFPIDGVAPGTNLAAKFEEKSKGVYELKLKTPIADLTKGRLKVSVRDHQGNVTLIDRTLSVGTSSSRK